MSKNRRTPASYLAAIITMNEKIEGRAFEGNSLTARLVREGKIIQSAVKSLNDIESNRKPTITEAAHLKTVANHASTLKRKVSEAKVRIQSTRQELFTQIDSNITEHLGLKESAYAGEIRTALRSMNDTDRAASIKTIIEAGDSGSLAAILTAPPVLTGITADMQGQYREYYEQKHAVALVKQRDDALETVQDLENVLTTATQSADNLVDEERIAQINSEVEAADAANAGFNDSWVI